jgi:hypothetical protein
MFFFLSIVFGVAILCDLSFARIDISISFVPAVRNFRTQKNLFPFNPHPRFPSHTTNNKK